MSNDVQHHSTTPETQKSQVDYILLDGSSSMQDKWWDSLDSIQAYIDGVRAANIHSRTLLHVFCSHDRDQLVRDVPISDWKHVRTEPYIGSHWGMTPLYDAINLMGRRLRDLDPPRASIVIVTDGADTGNEFTDETQARAILDWCRAKGWQVTFIGANFNNAKQARALGANEHNSIGVQQKKLVDAASALAKKRAAYGLYGADMHYTDDEKQQFGGYLNAPGK